MTDKYYETKLIVDGEFNPNREGPSEMKFTWPHGTEVFRPTEQFTITGVPTPPPSITFNANGGSTRPVMTIQADGKIVLHDDADPTEAAKQCIAAMERLLQDMLQKREDETVEKIAAWLGDGPHANCDDRSIAWDIRDRGWKIIST